MSQTLEILRLIDQFGWAYSVIAREQARYSRHHITNARLQDMTIDKMKGIDILYIPGPNMGYSQIRDNIVAYARKNKIRVVCGYAGEHEIMYPDADIIVAISAKFYPRLKELYKDRKSPVIYLPESVDTNFFVPSENKPKEFTVGWSGRVADVKRCHLLDQLDFKVVRKSDHGPQFFKDPNRPMEPMRDFYHSLSALILTSKTECMPRVVLEAMSCGVPVISTDVGSLRMVMDHQWLVPVNPESVIVSEINKKLHQLKDWEHIRKQAGERNRRHIEDFFSWKVNQPMWDQFFDEIYKEHYKSILIYNEEYRKKYSEFEPNLMK